MLAVLLLNRMSMKRRNTKRNTNKIERKVDEKSVVQKVVCRTCLSQQDLVSLFYDKENEKKRSEELKLVTGLEIKMNDELSQKICIKCVEAINNALLFRKECREAEKTLLSMTTAKKSRKKLEVKTKKKATKKKIKKITENEVELNLESANTNDDFNFDMNNDDFINDDFNNDDIKNDVANDGFGDSLSEEVVQPAPKSTRKRCMDIPNASSYKCPTCNKEFRMKSTFKAHLRFHTNFCVCESCGKRCRNNNQLQEHKRARHGLGRIHKCAYCEYSSATKEALVIHERRHTGERPYVCDHCGATFHRRSNLIQHIAIHLPEKNFQCEFCDKREYSQKRLNLHIYGRHKITNYRFVCPVCSGIFTRPRNVRKHLTRIHGIARPDQGSIQKVDKLMVPVTS